MAAREEAMRKPKSDRRGPRQREQAAQPGGATAQERSKQKRTRD
jgi:hypothetical protein